MSLEINIINVCEVVSINDPEGLDRIKVKLLPEDEKITDIDKLEYVFPLMPKYIFIKPKVGENVLVLTMSATDGNSQRFYIGPIIPQLNKMDENPSLTRGNIPFRGNSFRPEKSPYLDKWADGIFPDNDDISLIGKKNTDIQFKDNDLRIRCGISVPSTETSNFSGLMFNRKDPAYIKLRYNKDNEEDSKSYINIVADKINILGNKSLESFNTTDKKELTTDEEFNRILKEAHKLPYGEVLVEFLELMWKAFSNHTHKFSMLPPVHDSTYLSVERFNKKMLSDSVRIN